MRFDAGAGRFATLDATAGLWLRRAIDSEQAMVMPLRFNYGATLAEPHRGEKVWSRQTRDQRIVTILA